MNQTLLPIVLANENSWERTFLYEKLVKAGVENPLVTFGNSEDLMDYLRAVCVAAMPRLRPCLMLVDLKLPELKQTIGWVRSQEFLEQLKIVVLSEEEGGEPVPGADHGFAREPDALDLAKLVVCATARSG